MRYEFQRKALRAVIVMACVFVLPAVPAAGAFKPSGQKFDMREYNLGVDHAKIYNETRFTGTFLQPGGNEITGTLRTHYSFVGSQLRLRWSDHWSDGVSDFWYRAEYLYEIADEGVFETGFRVFNERITDASVPVSVATYDPPLITSPYGVYQTGDMWGGGFVETIAIFAYPETWRADARIVQYAILGVETVTVNRGTADEQTYTDCMKITRFRGNQSDRIAWYAKGIGVVKMVYAQPSEGMNIVYELREIRYE